VKEEKFVPQYDAIVIGAGQGGSALAFRLAALGQKVALVEEGRPPALARAAMQSLNAAARAAYAARRRRVAGVQTGSVRIDFGEIAAARDAAVLQVERAIDAQVASMPTLERVRGRARFMGPHTIDVGGNELTSERIFINTGASPRVPAIPGLAGLPFHTPASILETGELPRHVTVLGGSAAGLEVAQLFKRLGARATVIEENPHILPAEDHDVTNAVLDALMDDGIDVVEGARVTSIGRSTRSFDMQVTQADGSTALLLCSHLVLATATVPNTAGLGLEAAGIELDDDGFIITNQRLETDVPGVWAMGSVVGGPADAHVSFNDHQVLYENIFGGEERTAENRVVPHAMLTDPELGRVGMTETEARARGYSVRVATVQQQGTAGLLKAVLNSDDDRLLGAAVLGPAASEVIQTLATLMLANQPLAMLEQQVFIDGTRTEALAALLESVPVVELQEPRPPL